MTIANSGESIEITKGALRVTCTGAASLIEINQDNTGFVPLSGGEIIAGVIPAESSFLTEELGSKDAKTQIRFTGAGTVSYSRIVI
tara:strand:+ start:147 stop:404 length:258 start_codon:yes stop_codon:yes gene_type:complete